VPTDIMKLPAMLAMHATNHAQNVNSLVLNVLVAMMVLH